MAEVLNYLERAVSEGASDLLIVAGYPAGIKRAGEVTALEEEKLLSAQTQQLIAQLYELAGRPMEDYRRERHDSFSFAVAGLARFRVGAYYQRGSMAAAIRVVTFEIPDWQALHIPVPVITLTGASHGMIVVAGAAGSGRSTTQACMIDQLNKTRSCHIVTIEDPIEFLHRNQRSVISQQEIGLDVADRLSALRLCVWQAPDVVVLDRLDEWQTVQAAISLAETGHLVIAAVRAGSSVGAIDQLVDCFPLPQREQIRTRLSRVLRAVVAQQLLPGREGGRLPAFEQLRLSGMVQGMVREDRKKELAEALAGGNGMVSMDGAILELYREGKITIETALGYAENPEQMRRRCG